MVVAASLRPPTSTLKRAALVVRVSTDRQARAEEGSLTNQLQKLRQHITYKSEACGEEWAEAAIYELRAVSGKNSFRSPKFQRLFADIKAAKINTILCTALDRICRSVKDFLAFFEILNEYGVEFVCLKQHYDTTTPQGRLFVTIMMALAEFEREQTAERTRDATQARSERGLWNGGRLLGYDPNPEHRSRLITNEDEAAVVQAAFALYRECGSLKETAAGLTARGYRTKSFTSRRGVEHSGAAFRLNTVQYLLKNPAYMGKKEVNTQYRGKEAPAGKEYRLVDAGEPIIDAETFDEVQRLMATNGQHRHNGQAIRHTFVLSGSAVCGRCGGPLAGRSGTGKQGKVYFYYTCTRETCELRVVAAEVEDAVIGRIAALAENTGLVEALVTETNARLQRRSPVLARQQKALGRRLADVKGQAGALLSQWEQLERDHGRGFITEKLAELSQRRTELEQGMEQVQATLGQVRTSAMTAKAVQDALRRVHELYGYLQPHEQKELIALVVRKVEVCDRALVLEINGGVCSLTNEAPERSPSGAGFFQTPERLRDQDSNLEPIG
jgi:site-specific DNA recombinase